MEKINFQSNETERKGTKTTNESQNKYNNLDLVKDNIVYQEICDMFDDSTKYSKLSEEGKNRLKSSISVICEKSGNKKESLQKIKDFITECEGDIEEIDLIERVDKIKGEAERESRFNSISKIYDSLGELKSEDEKILKVQSLCFGLEDIRRTCEGHLKGILKNEFYE